MRVDVPVRTTTTVGALKRTPPTATTIATRRWASRGQSRDARAKIKASLKATSRAPPPTMKAPSNQATRLGAAVRLPHDRAAPTQVEIALLMLLGESSCPACRSGHLRLDYALWWPGVGRLGMGMALVLRVLFAAAPESALSARAAGASLPWLRRIRPSPYPRTVTLGL
jgi:hypothetical protein